MNLHSSNQPLEWANTYLITHGITILNQKRMIQTSYSDIYQIETTHGIFYLKQVPEVLFIEPQMLVFLHDQGCKNIPKLITQNITLHCFLMTSCGDISLRHLFKKKLTSRCWGMGLWITQKFNVL